jgi:hypothetical protein
MIIMNELEEFVNLSLLMDMNIGAALAPAAIEECLTTLMN